MTPQNRDPDDPHLRELARELYDWLADGQELAYLQKLVEQSAKSRKRRPYRRSQHRVRRSDGSVASSAPRTAGRPIRAVGIPRNPLLKIVAYLQANGDLDSPVHEPAKDQARPASRSPSRRSRPRTGRRPQPAPRSSRPARRPSAVSRQARKPKAGPPSSRS